MKGMIAALWLVTSAGPFAHATDICHGKPNEVMTAAGGGLADALSRKEIKVPEIAACGHARPGAVLGFEHGGETLYLVQGICGPGSRTVVHAVMRCDSSKSRFEVLGVSYAGPKGNGVIGGPF
jgi:hypothetical protein